MQSNPHIPVSGPINSAAPSRLTGPLYGGLSLLDPAITNLADPANEK